MMTEPTTLEELIRAVNGYRGDDKAWTYGLFWCMQGHPRAYMEIPEVVCDGVIIKRYVYTVIGFASDEPKEIAEPRLVQAMYKHLLDCRRDALRVCNIPDLKRDPAIPPVMFVRRELELDVNFDTNNTRLTYRICIPGVDLRRYDIYYKDPQYHGSPTYTSVDCT